MVLSFKTSPIATPESVPVMGQVRVNVCTCLLEMHFSGQLRGTIDAKGDSPFMFMCLILRNVEISVT